ncbi:MAG TPA: MarR family transcriptional regulator [Symbiobacteriaceae bacterium]
MRATIPVDRYTAELDELLHAMGNLTRRQTREIMSEFDVTPPQCEALMVLKEYGSLAMGELCQKVGSACSTATDLIDRMERNGLVERVRDPRDRRVIRLHITPKGEEVVERVVEASRTNLARKLQGLSDQEKERLVQTLEMLHYLLLQPTSEPRA